MLGIQLGLGLGYTVTCAVTCAVVEYSEGAECLVTLRTPRKQLKLLCALMTVAILLKDSFVYF